MSAAALVNPDAGAQIVSPSVELRQAEPLDLHPLFLLPGEGSEPSLLGLGDGSVRAFSPENLDQPPETLVELDGLLSGLKDLDAGAVLLGNDRGELYRLAGGEAALLSRCGGEWITSLALHCGAGLRAFTAGRTLVVLDSEGKELLRRDQHPSTLSGLVFSPNGTWAAVSHYGGVTVWNLAEPEREPLKLEWHGSHTSVTWSPDGRFIITAMQDKEIHCWRWSDRKDMRMSGYPSKIRSLDWTADGHYLAASGADSVTSWDCTGKGPSGKPPLEFGYVYNSMVHQVAAHPSARLVAGGYSDGTVLIGEIEQESAMIARPGKGSPVAALAWRSDGELLLAADARGGLAAMRLEAAAV